MERDFFYFLTLLPNEGQVLDLGANIGIMAYHLSKALPQAKIQAFEPVPQNLNVLKRIITHFKLENVIVHPYALGNESGSIEMVVPVVADVKMQGLSHVVHDTITAFNQGETFQVPVKRLDEIPELQEQRTTGIKIDVENFEYFVLEGGRQLIQKHQPIIYSELWENENREKVFELLSQLNYSINIVQSNQLVEFNQTKHHTQNFIFLPNS